MLRLNPVSFVLDLWIGFCITYCVVSLWRLRRFDRWFNRAIREMQVLSLRDVQAGRDWVWRFKKLDAVLTRWRKSHFWYSMDDIIGNKDFYTKEVRDEKDRV